MDPWAAALLPAVRLRNRCERGYAELIAEHARLQALARQLAAERKQLARTVAALQSENELLEQDVAASKSGTKASGPRVKALEAELRSLQTDMNEFRKSQQKVICRYDDDLAEARRRLDASEAKAKCLQKEKAELLTRLESTNIKLHRTNDELENTEKEKELLLQIQRDKLEGLADVKTKAVLKALAQLREQLGVAPRPGGRESPPQDGAVASPPGRMTFGGGDDMLKLTNYVRDVIDDAVEHLGDEGPCTIAQCLEDEAEDFTEWFNQWHERWFDDALLAKKVLFDAEGWVPPTRADGRVAPELDKVTTFMTQLGDGVAVLERLPVPCGRAWERYAVAVGEAAMLVAAEVCAWDGGERRGSVSNGSRNGVSSSNASASSKAGARSPPLPPAAGGEFSPAHLGFYRLNSLAALDAQYDTLLTRLLAAWHRRPPHLRGTGAVLGAAAAPRKPLRLNTHTLAETVPAVLASSHARFAALGAELAGAVGHAVLKATAEPLQHLYTVDMAHYKKWKSKDSYTKTNQHLKPATAWSMRSVVDALRKQTMVVPATPTTRATDWSTQAYVHAAQDLSRGLVALLLDGGDKRWFYPEQHAALEEDLVLLKQFFLGAGVPRDAVAAHFGRVSTVVSAMMSQPTQQLIAGGGVCVPFSELPPHAKGVWSQGTVLQVLAHRKDKQAKAFMKKEEKLFKKLRAERDKLL
eukprot:TRINITY_DN1006_c3_g1_i2.p1 TRINITY_DN1006_c3_g1~~TRINITY_DN1006_c3_g1_i2.p1  ORF type:complete len:697 (+),score=289.36 TRINITY_DN1006_c3_g1_i2:123-2213(+)